jgi:Mg2+ and Co2+ transporter CorA
LISNQQQGIEMYSLARDVMDVDEFYREIKEEIHNANDYLTAEESRELSETTTKLTKVATIVLPIVLASSFFGMNMFSGDKWVFLWLLFFGIVAVGYLKLIPYMTGKRLSDMCGSNCCLPCLKDFVEQRLDKLKKFFRGHTSKGTD